MQTDSVELLPRLRSFRKLHYAVVFVMTATLLTACYGLKQSLPLSPGSAFAWFWRVFFFEYRNDALGLMLLVPMLYAAVTLGWKRALFIMVLIIGCITPYIVDFSHRAMSFVTSYTFLIIPPLLFVSGEIKLISDIKDRLAQEEKRRQRAEVIKHLIRGQEDERKRIAQELHDGVIQSLLILATTAHNLLESPGPANEAARADLAAIKDRSLELVSEVRAVCQGLRPSVLDNLGFLPAVKSLVYKTGEETGLDIDLVVQGDAYELGPEERLGLYRMVQEALNNITKHARASSVRVVVAFDDRGVTIEVMDDGVGFALEAGAGPSFLDGKFGLLGMSERARALGADLRISSAEGLGTRVQIHLARGCPGQQTTNDFNGTGFPWLMRVLRPSKS